MVGVNFAKAMMDLKMNAVLMYRWARFHVYKRIGLNHKNIGGYCYGCEALREYNDADNLTSEVELPGYKENEPKLEISGVIYQRDGKTPASGVIMYLYQTNKKGLYECREGEKGWIKEHGIVRGWLRTGEDGRYLLKTFRPAPYPELDLEEHIHAVVKEPGKNEYEIDDFVFDDDPLLTPSRRTELKKRGGSGILTLTKKGDAYVGTRNIILGLNVQNYNQDQ